MLGRRVLTGFAIGLDGCAAQAKKVSRTAKIECLILGRIIKDCKLSNGFLTRKKTLEIESDHENADKNDVGFWGLFRFKHIGSCGGDTCRQVDAN